MRSRGERNEVNPLKFMNKYFAAGLLFFFMVLSSSFVWAQPEAATPGPVKAEILASDMSFDLETGRIMYTLPEPALVRLRIGFGQGGALLINLVDWERREAGQNIEVWDFKDATGNVVFEKRKDFKIVLACIPVSLEEQKIYQSSIKGFRKAPRFEVTFPESEMTDGVPLFKPMDPVRVTLDKEDQKWLTETKYELGIFINNAFLMEDEEGVNPFTYRVNTTGLRAGIHIITVNVVGYEGEIGTKSVRVKILK